MRLPPFDYFAPESLSQALKIKSELGASARIGEIDSFPPSRSYLSRISRDCKGLPSNPTQS